MPKIQPNQNCPCGSNEKYKRCCFPYLQGKNIDHVERLLRARYVASSIGQIEFLWNSLHPEAPRKIHDTFKVYQAELQVSVGWNYTELIILDGIVNEKDAKIVSFVRMDDNGQDLSYLEEAEYQVFEGQWFYKDGLRRSAAKIKMDPSLVKVGDLATLFPWDGGLN